MATPEGEQLPNLFFFPRLEEPEEPVHVFINELGPTDRYEPRLIEAGWDDDTKVAATFDIYEDIAELGGIRRPLHWKEDTRSAEEQVAEYRIALGAIIEHVVAMRFEALEVGPLENLVAEAMLRVATPEGWQRQSKVEGWSEGDAISVRRAVAYGETISFRYTRSSEPEVETADNLRYLPGFAPEITPAA